ncbi:MAG: type II secretion system protein [Planctomycetota bacterium]
MPLSTAQANAACRKAFTLVELLVVVSIIALLVAILLPSLTKARKQARMVMCLSNVRSIGLAVMTYASEYGGTLPGPLHPAVYRNLGMGDPGGDDPTKYERERQLTWKLRPIMGDKGMLIGSMGDNVSICPELDLIVPQQFFYDFRTRFSRGGLYPTHYAINNWGRAAPPEGSSGGVDPNPRPTKPQYYFGLSWPPPGDPTKDTGPVDLTRVRNASREWMLADAWYRPRSGTNPKLPKQEGPYQSSWSGEAMPYYAPHMRRGASGYEFSTSAARDVQCTQVRNAKSDGLTVTAFFDNHAEALGSVRGVAASFELFYGFRGTVNPDTDFEKPPWWGP